MQAIHDTVLDIEAMLAQDLQRKSLDFFANVPCPMKPGFKQAYESMAAEHYSATGERFYSYVLTHCSSKDERLGKMADIENATSEDELPGLFFAHAMGTPCKRNFVERFIKTGVFEEVIVPGERQLLSAPEFIDPYGATNTVAMFAYAILVDKLRIGDLPVPENFYDLLDPVYENSISLPDSHGLIDVTLPLYMRKFYGDDAVRALERNVVTATSTLDAVKRAGNPTSQGAPIYIVSWMFANSNIRSEKAQLIWPKDGALCEPIVLFAKKNRDKKADRIVDFINSNAVTSLYEKNYLPATHPAAVNRMPENAKQQWIGWDYLYHNDLPAMFEELGARFSKYIPEKD